MKTQQTNKLKIIMLNGIIAYIVGVLTSLSMIITKLVLYLITSRKILISTEDASLTAFIVFFGFWIILNQWKLKQ